MTLGDAAGLTETQEMRAVRGLQFVLAALTVYGSATFQIEVAMNAAIPLGITFLPAVLRREYSYTMDAGLVLLLTVAVFLHAIGSLTLYRNYPWYDEITHTVSAILVAGIGYAILAALERHTGEIDLPSALRSVFILVFVLAFGVVWEVFEFTAVWLSRNIGVRSPVRVFGIEDIVTDMVFNAIGALIVAVWGSGYFDDLVPVLGRRLRSNDD